MTDNVTRYGFKNGSAKPSWIVRKVSWNFGSYTTNENQWTDSKYSARRDNMISLGGSPNLKYDCIGCLSEFVELPEGVWQAPGMALTASSSIFCWPRP